VLARITASFAGDVAPTMEELSAAAGVSRTVLYSLFGSRAGLLEAMGADVPAASSARITAAAAELVAERGLAGLSLDEVAHRAGVSRATVYRLYPGKSALFGEVVRTYLAVDEALGLLERLADRPPAEVMPLLARALTQSGSIRIGLLRTVLLEVTRGVEGTEEVLQETYENTKVMIGYIERQMAAGRLLRMDPVLAMQIFLAPVVLHSVSRPWMEDSGLVPIPLEEAVEEMAQAWLRAMAPPRHRPAVPATASRRRSGGRASR